MDWFTANEMVNKRDESFWVCVLEKNGVKPTTNRIKRLQQHFFNFLYATKDSQSFEHAWSVYEDSTLPALIEAFKQRRYEREEFKSILGLAFGSLSGLKSSKVREIKNVMMPFVAAGLVEHRVVRGGGHFWQPDHLQEMDFDAYLELLTDRYFEMLSAGRNAA